MEYELIDAFEEDFDRLFNYKLMTILKNDENLSKDELLKIKNYVKENISLQLVNYKIILVNNEKIGCLLVVPYGDGYLIDEIFIEDKYRGRGIGKSLLKNILNNNENVYLWVYKNNTFAFNLYLKLGFIIIRETDTRYFMKK